jgi:hypothetical protein
MNEAALFGASIVAVYAAGAISVLRQRFERLDSDADLSHPWRVIDRSDSQTSGRSTSRLACSTPFRWPATAEIVQN